MSATLGAWSVSVPVLREIPSVTFRSTPRIRNARHRAPAAPRAIAAAALLLAACLPVAAHAWSAKGHRLIAGLADTELSPRARAEIARLLRDEAAPGLVGVASWADDLRDHPQTGDPDLARRASPWHYINLGEDHCDYRAAAHCPDGNCVVGAILQQRALLADRTRTDAVRAQALKFLVHLVGDAHQPMHAGYGRDKGGNTVQLQVQGKGSNLHQLWDSGLIGSARMSEPAYLRHLRDMPLPAGADDHLDDPEAWAEASCRIATGDGVYPVRRTVPASYFARWRPTVDAQLRIAGHRLAVLLNATLDTTPGQR